MLNSKLLMTVGGEENLYSDDVFSAHTYTGNGSTQTITNGIDLSTNGGMVWVKARSSAYNNVVADTARGAVATLSTNLTTAEQTGTGTKDIYSFDTTGFKVGTDFNYNCNTSAVTYASWTFRKAPKFFDVVTWTGNSTPRTIAHSLGSAPGMIMVKKTNTTDSWYVYHRSLGNGGVLYLEQTAAAGTGSSYWNSTDPTTSVFSVGGNTGVNGTGNTYVAYLFAHDASTDGIVQCGSFTVTGGARQTITLGWEPQYLLMKSVTNAETWEVLDTSRVLTTDSTAAMLQPNSSAAESAGGTSMGARLTATGFTAQNSNATYIYLAIRRSNKPPTTGTQVYNSAAYTGTSTVRDITGVGFAPDSVLSLNRTPGGASYGNKGWVSRLRGPTAVMRPNNTTAEATVSDATTAFLMDGISVGADSSNALINWVGGTWSTHFFKRAPGVFDEVCYTGTGVAKTEAHGLGVVPELMIVKARNSADNWPVNIGTTTGYLELNTTQQSGTAASYWNSTVPTSSVFSLGNNSVTNGNTVTYIAYLFATKAGISKVFSYTGNGSSQTINCGFTTGARFILIKRTDAAGDWYVWDTVRGIIAGNDPHLSLNTTSAEVTTDDSIDSDTTGFICNQSAATNINVNSATYIGLAFA